MFSFSAYKPLGSSGNGAMLVTNSDELCEKLRLLAGYGHDPIREGVTVGYQNYVEEGYNVPLDGLEAAVLSVKLPYLKEWTKKRRAICLSARSGLGTYIGENARVSRRVGAAHSVPMRSASTDNLMCTTGLETPESKHLSVMRRQYMIIPFTPACSQNRDALPVTERLGKEILNLPITPEFTSDDVDYMIDVTRDLLKQN